MVPFLRLYCLPFLCRESANMFSHKWPWFAIAGMLAIVLVISGVALYRYVWPLTDAGTESGILSEPQYQNPVLPITVSAKFVVTFAKNRAILNST